MRALLLIPFVALLVSEIPMGRPLKEDESYVLDTLESIQIGKAKSIVTAKVEHKCVEVDSHGVQHIQANYLEGKVRVDGGEPEDVKGEYFNYYQNAFGQQFEYEEVRAKLEDDPLLYMREELHAKLKDHSVVEEETWQGKSTNTEYTIAAGKIRKFMNTDCIDVTRKGSFTNGMTGTFKEHSYYRVKDGQLMYRETLADDVTAPNLEPVDYLERVEFVEK